MAEERIVNARLLCSVPPLEGMSELLYWQMDHPTVRLPKTAFHAFLMARLTLYRAMAAQHDLPLTEGTYGEGYEDWYVVAPLTALTPLIDDLLALGFQEPGFVLYVPATEEGLAVARRYRGQVPMDVDEEYGGSGSVTEAEFDLYAPRINDLLMG